MRTLNELIEDMRRINGEFQLIGPINMQEVLGKDRFVCSVCGFCPSALLQELEELQSHPDLNDVPGQDTAAMPDSNFKGEQKIEDILLLYFAKLFDARSNATDETWADKITADTVLEIQALLTAADQAGYTRGKADGRREGGSLGHKIYTSWPSGSSLTLGDYVEEWFAKHDAEL